MYVNAVGPKVVDPIKLRFTIPILIGIVISCIAK